MLAMLGNLEVYEEPFGTACLPEGKYPDKPHLTSLWETRYNNNNNINNNNERISIAPFHVKHAQLR